MVHVSSSLVSCSQVSVAISLSIFPFVSSSLIMFSMLFIDLALTVDNLMLFTISSLLASVVTICLRFCMSIPHAVLLPFLFLVFLVLFNFSSQIVLIVPKGRPVRLFGFVCLQISLSWSLVYEDLAPGFVVAFVGPLLMVSDWGTV